MALDTVLSEFLLVAQVALWFVLSVAELSLVLFETFKRIAFVSDIFLLVWSSTNVGLQSLSFKSDILVFEGVRVWGVVVLFDLSFTILFGIAKRCSTLLFTFVVSSLIFLVIGSSCISLLPLEVPLLQSRFKEDTLLSKYPFK